MTTRHTLVGLALILSLGCSSSDDGSKANTDGNTDPRQATCDTRAVLSCTDGGACRSVFSDAASKPYLPLCQETKDSITTDCDQRYAACCVFNDGSNGYPERICVGASDASYAKENCLSAKNSVWCGD